MNVLDEYELIEIIRQQYKQLSWTPAEQIYRSRPNYRSKLLEDYEVTFGAAVLIKFRNSVFGTYMGAFNKQQKQDKFLNNNKLGITQWDLKELTPVEKQGFIEKNNLTDDIVRLLVKAVEEADLINWEYLFAHLSTLRIDDFYITTIDDNLKKFRNVQVLVLCGNWIEEIPGQYLPRKLKYLEMFLNEVSSINSLCDNPPKNLMHIGLSRNKFTQYSDFEILEVAPIFKVLRSLDLSDNDICNLLAVVEPLGALTQLTNLQLEGNPCSTCMAYKDVVLSSLPQLLYLDKTQICEGDKADNDFLPEYVNKAALTFTCHRITGLPPPPKQKNAVQTLHLEVTLPLLEDIIADTLTEQFDKDQQANPAQKKGVGKDKGKKGSPYDAPDEYESEKKLNIKDTSFKTPRMLWAKVIQFPEEVLVVESPECNFTAIRDTFRSTVNVKVVYLKVLPPAKAKKAGKKGKKGGKGDKKKKKGDSPADQTQQEPKEPQETIAKKVTLANFFCDLHNVNWSDKTIDFYWANHPETNPKAIPVEGSLRAINYIEGKGKKGRKSKEPKGKGKDKKGSKGKGDKVPALPQEITRIPSKQFLPEIFTCQIGFGLKRSYPVL